MKRLKAILILTASIFVCISNAHALNLGSQITIYDNRAGNPSTWYNRGINPGEDQEVEPGMVANQSWDLEGFFLKDGRYLSMVGGFNFKDGNGGYQSGDIFLDTSNPLNAKYGISGGLPYGYDYVLQLDFNSKTYNVYQLTNNSKFIDVFSYNSPESSPWRYGGVEPGAAPNPTIASGNFTYQNSLNNGSIDGVYFDGDTASHYAVSGFDLSFLPGGTTFISHFTMQCGNDNLMGQGTTAVPEPTTLLLLGLGLVGLGISSRKLRK